MPPKKRNFRRPLGERRYRKLFIVATEGVKTELQYFGILNYHYPFIHMNLLKSSNSPLEVLKCMKDHLKKEPLKNLDEAWLVVDKDQWTDEQLAQLYRWSQDADNYGFALSNPKFEYWLLLHFEDGTNIGSSRECSARLNNHIPGYDKGLEVRKFTPDMVEAAIRRAKVRDNPPCADWPRTLGSTTVYKLVENILSERP